MNIEPTITPPQSACADGVYDVPLANVVDTDYTSVAKIAKQYLPGTAAMAGTHGRLAELARRYRS